MVVVENQEQLAIGVGCGEFVDQRRHQAVEGRWRGRAEQRRHPRGDPRPRAVERRDGVLPESGRVAVAGVEREPGSRPPTAADPISQQVRLPEPGRSAHERQPARECLIEPIHQPLAGHEARLRLRQVQLGGQQHVALVDLGRDRSRPLRHDDLPLHVFSHAPPRRAYFDRVSDWT